MHELVNLKEKLCRELEEYSQRSRFDASNIQIIDTLAHTIKNLNKILDHENVGNYSEAPHMRGSYSYGRNNGYSNGYNYGSSRYNMGDWRANDYNMAGRYSMSNDEMMKTLTRLMNEAPDERTRMEFQKFMNHMEQM